MSLSARAGLPTGVEKLDARLVRDYGVTMGDIVDQRIELELASGYAFDGSYLPNAGSNAGDGIELRAVDWREDGRTITVHTAYQIFKGVKSVEALVLPALPMRLRRGTQVYDFEAPAGSVSMLPLITPGTADEQIVIRPALPPEPLESDGNGWLIGGTIGLLALSLEALRRLGLPPFRSRRITPFAAAARRLKRLGRGALTDAKLREAIREVHDALAQSAGRTLFVGQLDGWLAERPELEPFRSTLSEFFAFSDRLFFEASADVSAPTPDYLARLERLCLDLAAAGG